MESWTYAQEVIGKGGSLRFNEFKGTPQGQAVVFEGSISTVMILIIFMCGVWEDIVCQF